MKMKKGFIKTNFFIYTYEKKFEDLFVVKQVRSRRSTVK